MKTPKNFHPILFASAFIALAAASALPAHAALEWDKTEFSAEVRRGAQELVRTTFEVKNTGTKPVTILGVTTSCGCTTADPEESRIPAGGKTTLYARFTLGSRTGQQDKKITVTTDDPAAAQVVLTFKVNIVEPPAAPAHSASPSPSESR